MQNRSTQLLLNFGHAMDHMFLLIFATAVSSIAAEFGFEHWEDLMPYSVAAFFLFGVGSLPSGKLGDQWGRRPMMVVFFLGIGAASLWVSQTQSPLHMAMALALLGAFASIYHPVAIPMLVQGSARPGWTIGVNGLCGNLGVALAAVVTGLFVKYYGWRMAFLIPGVISIVCGLAFARWATHEASAPSKEKSTPIQHSGLSMPTLLLVMTLASTSSSLLFNLSTNSNYELLADKLVGLTQDPAQIGLLLGLVYAAASLSQLWVGHMIDKVPLKHLYLRILAFQALVLIVATQVDGWWFYGVQFLFMAGVFGAIPFTDAMIVRFVDDTMRSRVTGMRLAVSFGASSIAVLLIGPIVKQSGFTTLLAVMAVSSLVTLAVISQLPASEHPA